MCREASAKLLIKTGNGAFDRISPSSLVVPRPSAAVRETQKAQRPQLQGRIQFIDVQDVREVYSLKKVMSELTRKSTAVKTFIPLAQQVKLKQLQAQTLSQGYQSRNSSIQCAAEEHPAPRQARTQILGVQRAHEQQGE